MQLTGSSLALPSGNSTSSPGEHVLLPCLVLVRCWWLCTTPGGFVGHTALDFVKCRAMGTTEIQQVIAGGGACSGGKGFAQVGLFYRVGFVVVKKEEKELQCEICEINTIPAVDCVSWDV